MKSRLDALADTARQWVLKAENDLTVVTTMLRLGRRCPTDVVCFHAQQLVEKYHKAVLIARGVDFPRTHDLNALARLLPKALVPLLSDEERRRLTDYAVLARYPQGYDVISLAEAAVLPPSLATSGAKCGGSSRGRPLLQ